MQPCLEYGDLSARGEWRVLDVGFGLGLDWLAIVDAAMRAGKSIRIVSLEKDAAVLSHEYPLQSLPEIHPLARQAFLDLKTQHRVQTDRIQAEILLGDGLQTLSSPPAGFFPFDAILQDAFSPRNNPPLWGQDFFYLIARHCRPGSVLATYSAAGAVRRNLASAGFTVTKLPGLGGKREQVVARYQCSV